VHRRNKKNPVEGSSSGWVNEETTGKKNWAGGHLFKLSSKKEDSKKGGSLSLEDKNNKRKGL